MGFNQEFWFSQIIKYDDKIYFQMQKPQKKKPLLPKAHFSGNY